MKMKMVINQFKYSCWIISTEWRIEMKDDFEKFLEKQLQNEEFRKEWESFEPEYAIMKALIETRTSKGLTQKELSIRSGIAQGDISKIEHGNANPSIKTLKRLAAAMGKNLKIEFTDPDPDKVRSAL